MEWYNINNLKCKFEKYWVTYSDYWLLCSYRNSYIYIVWDFG
jgi:hypothetical protein